MIGYIDVAFRDEKPAVSDRRAALSQNVSAAR